MNHHDYNLDELRAIRVRGLKFYIMPRYRCHYVDNDYEDFSLDLMLRFAGRDSTVVDVGAHYGIYSLLAARAGARVVAFEPLPENFEVLRKNIRANRLDVDARQSAASDAEGRRHFNVPWASDSAGFSAHPIAETIRTIEVSTRTIDSVLAGTRVDVLKIDTEGHEIEVLRGASDTLAANPRLKLLVEFSPACLASAGHEPEELLTHLLDHGFRPYVVHEDRRQLDRIDDPGDWRDQMLGRAYANLLCVSGRGDGDLLTASSEERSETRPADRFASLAHRVLMRSIAARRVQRVAPVWDRGWRWAGARWGGRRTRTTLHGIPAVVNFAHPYPVWARRWPTYNDAVVEAVLAAAEMAGRPVAVVDVGANVGDTAMLLSSSAAAAVARLIAVEADPEFLGYLTENLANVGFPTDIWATYLSRDGSDVPDAVRTYAGTAELRGPGTASTRRLDDVWTEHGSPAIHVLKSDTDGFDGQVIAGARELLASSRPVVLFEWAPTCFDSTNNDSHEPFAVLSELGYDRFIWFDKYGEFNHIEVGYNRATVEAQAALCRHSTSLLSWYYDVLALHPEHPLSAVGIGDLRRAAAHKVPVEHPHRRRPMARDNPSRRQ
jgi:FkbM family methyltransferase